VISELKEGFLLKNTSFRKLKLFQFFFLFFYQNLEENQDFI